MLTTVGAQLDATTGKWQHGAPSGYAYQWQRGDEWGTFSSFTNIAGAASDVYTVVAADEKHTIRCAVTATNTKGNGTTYTPVFVIKTGRTDFSRVFSYAPGGQTGNEGNIGCYPAASPGSPCVLILHEGGFTEQTTEEEPVAGEETPENNARGTLSAPLSTAVNITEIAVNSLPIACRAGEWIELNDHAGNHQNFEITAPAAVGAIVIKVASLKPIFAFPATTTTLAKAHKMENRGQAENMQGKGWAAFTLNWRQDSEAVKPGWTIEIADVEAALAWIKNNAELFNGDAGRVCILGGSSGASLGMMAATKLNELKPGYVRGIAALSGLSDLAKRCIECYEEQEAIEGKFGALSETLSTAANITVIPTKPLTTAIAAGAKFSIFSSDEEHEQEWKAEGEAAKGATSITVVSQKPTFAFVANTTKIGEKPDAHIGNHLAHIAYFCGYDKVKIKKHGFVTGDLDVQDVMNKVSPAYHVGAGLPKILYYISELETVFVPPVQGTIMVEKATAAGQGSKVTFIERKGVGGHAFAYWAEVSTEVDEFLKAA